MNIQLQDHGYPGNLSIPITINIDLSGTIKPGTPKPNPTPTQPAINPTPTEPATNPPPTKPATKRPTDSDKGSGKTSEPALSLYGDSIAAFLNSESGKAFAQMAGIDRSFSEPPLNAYKREEIDKAIKNIAQEAATDLTCGLIERLILELTDGGVEAPDDGPTSPETSPPGPKEPPTDNVDTQNPDGPDPVITKPKISTPSEELTEYLTKYIHDNLAEFYLLGASDHRVEQMIVRAEELTKQLTEKFKVPAELVPKLATIGLYEIVVLLDDSGSMKPGSSINAAKEAIIRLFQIANTINPYLSSVAHHYSGSFSVVPYGNENLHGLDKFASEADLRTKLDQIQFNTSHSMDGPLALKVFSPANKTNSGSIVTPHLVVIITDGYLGETEVEKTIEAIAGFKANVKAHGYSSPTSLVTAICDVGPEPQVSALLAKFESSPDVNNPFHVYKENPLSEKMATVLSKALAGIDSQKS